MAPEEQLPREMKVMKVSKSDLSADPQVSQSPPSARAVMLTLSVVVTVIVILTLYLLFSSTLSDPAPETPHPESDARPTQETPEATPSSPSGADSQAKSDSKSQ